MILIVPSKKCFSLVAQGKHCKGASSECFLPSSAFGDSGKHLQHRACRIVGYGDCSTFSNTKHHLDRTQLHSFNR